MGYKKMLFAGLTAWMSLSSFAFDLNTESQVVIKGDTMQMAPVAKTALKMLQGDIKKVLGSEMKLQMSSLSKTSDKNIIILSKDAAAFAYKKEAFQIKAENGNLYIKGSCQRILSGRYGCHPRQEEGEDGCCQGRQG